MKIRSITDVITNSSTEVFLLETNKSLEEVERILGGLTTGYRPPEILTDKKSGILGEISDFGGCLYDDESKQEYMYSRLEHNFREDITKLWNEYVWENQEYLDQEIRKSYSYYSGVSKGKLKEFCADSLYWYVDSIPEDFLPNFLEKVWAKPLPKFLEIPPELTFEYWKGKIGIIGEKDNSIPYDDFDKILSIFGGISFHLG